MKIAAAIVFAIVAIYSTNANAVAARNLSLTHHIEAADKYLVIKASCKIFVKDGPARINRVKRNLSKVDMIIEEVRDSASVEVFAKIKDAKIKMFSAYMRLVKTLNMCNRIVSR